MLFDASPSNRVVASRLERKLAESSDQPLLFKDSIPEYGGCRYLLQCDAASPDSLLLSIGFSQDTAREIDVTHDEAVEALQQHIGPCASVQNTPLPGYHFSVTVDVPQLRTCTRDQQTRWIERLASIRLALQGAPLRTLLVRWLADGHDGAQDALLPLYSSPDGAWYCRTSPDSLTAIYPIRLKHFPDPTMLSALLQEFADGAAASGMPTSVFAPSTAPPSALREAPAGSLEDVDGGYVQVSIDRRHCSEDALPGLIWQLLTFYLFVRYQAQLSKVALHSHMRQRLGASLAALQSAKRPAFDGGI